MLSFACSGWVRSQAHPQRRAKVGPALQFALKPCAVSVSWMLQMFGVLHWMIDGVTGGENIVSCTPMHSCALLTGSPWTALGSSDPTFGRELRLLRTGLLGAVRGAGSEQSSVRSVPPFGGRSQLTSAVHKWVKLWANFPVVGGSLWSAAPLRGLCGTCGVLLGTHSPWCLFAGSGPFADYGACGASLSSSSRRNRSLPRRRLGRQCIMRLCMAVHYRWR